jgi:hypothetical protein
VSKLRKGLADIGDIRLQLAAGTTFRGFGSMVLTTCRVTRTGRRRFLDYIVGVLERVVYAMAAQHDDSWALGRPDQPPFLSRSFVMQSTLESQENRSCMWPAGAKRFSVT